MTPNEPPAGRRSGVPIEAATPFRIRCPGCCRPLLVRREQSGRALRCPHCRRAMRAPEPAATTAEVLFSIVRPCRQ